MKLPMYGGFKNELLKEKLKTIPLSFCCYDYSSKHLWALSLTSLHEKKGILFITLQIIIQIARFITKQDKRLLIKYLLNNKSNLKPIKILATNRFLFLKEGINLH